MSENSKVVRHELDTLHGLYAFDGMAPALSWPLDTTKTRAALDELDKSHEELAAVLIEYERIEAEIIFDDECWNFELPQHYYDRLIELQHKRNAALEKAGYSFEMRAKTPKAEGGES